MRKHKSARIISVLIVLILSTACSTTDQTTITAAPGDTPTGGDAPAPTDGTAAPGRDTAAPGDTPTGGDAPAPTDGTAAPGRDTGTTSTDTPETPVTVGDQDSADGQESAEPASFTYEYPEFLLINRNDRSTPLGKLCWAFFEYMSNVLIRSSGIVAEFNPNWKVTFPAVADITEGVDNGVGPVGIVNEESDEPSMGTEDYFVESLDEILEPSIVGIVDDTGLSEELQLFAEAFFAYIEAEEREARAVGWANIDRARLPYQDFEDLPHMKEFEETLTANPDKCAFPSEDEWNPFLDEQEAELEEYYERNRQSVNIE